MRALACETVRHRTEFRIACDRLSAPRKSAFHKLAAHFPMPTPKLIALDWGSTSARAYLMAEESEVIGQRQAPLGVLNVKNRDFEGALLELCGPWLMVRTNTPIIAAGMIGSRQGWIEAPYVEVPAGLSELAQRMTTIEIPKKRKLWIVPGMSTAADATTPDVMRGEETQIYGALTVAQRADGNGLFILPGTHSKWVRIENGRIVWFKTFMTGELYSVLTQHSILGRLMEPSTEYDANAFERAVYYSHSDPFGLSAQLFSARTLALFDQLARTGIGDYLSGLLIGHEIYTAEKALAVIGVQPEAVTLIGDVGLMRNYQRALTLLGWSSRAAPAFPSATGLWRIAVHAGLLGMSVESLSVA
jgi:2-dehydro-3-deoxygalactonokinase